MIPPLQAIGDGVAQLDAHGRTTSKPYAEVEYGSRSG